MLVPYLKCTSIPLVSTMKMKRVMTSLIWGTPEAPLSLPSVHTHFPPTPWLMQVVG